MALGVAALLASSAAHADFTIAKPKPVPTAKPSENRRPAARKRVAATPKPLVPEVLTGIDPQLMQEVIVQAGMSAKTTFDTAARTALIQIGNAKIGWSANFKDCADEHHCRAMDIYTLWNVPNEVNVCTVWGQDVTKDPLRKAGTPYCYTVQPGDKHLHLKLSSEQYPYAGVERMARAQARDVLQHMVGVWTYHLELLPQAWKLAEQKCPKRTDNCAGGIRIKG
jgi:hypothetical protein